MTKEHVDLTTFPQSEVLQERQEAAERLHHSRMMYQRLFEAAQDGILILEDLSGRIINANPFVEQLLHYEHGEMTGKELWEIGLFQDIAANRKAFQTLREHGYIRYEHLPLRARNGNDVEVEFVSNVFRVEGQTVIQCNIRDITERRRLERQMMEQTILLVDLNRRKDEFLAMLSHELRNPLAAILSAAHLLRLNLSEVGSQKRARTIIERQVNQLSRLVGDLMGISRLTSDHIHVVPKRVDLNDVVRQSVETAQRCVEQHRHVLNVTLPAHPLWAEVDAGRMEQVIVNLLENACKYTNKGGHIELTLEQQDKTAVMTVRDNGTGMAAELLPRVFDLFTQGQRSLGRPEGGLGIGLTLVKRIIELHDGTVEAKSAGVGLGSEFVVRLDAMREETQRTVTPVLALSPASGKRVLIVDDNVDAADALSLLLDAEGHVTRTIYLGELVVGAALTFRPDIVLLDIGLPDMNGYKVAERLRGHPQLGHVRIFALTGYGQDSDLVRSEAAGFDHHLVKPIDHALLYALLHDTKKDFVNVSPSV